MFTKSIVRALKLWSFVCILSAALMKTKSWYWCEVSVNMKMAAIKFYKVESICGWWPRKTLWLILVFGLSISEENLSLNSETGNTVYVDLEFVPWVGLLSHSKLKKNGPGWLVFRTFVKCIALGVALFRPTALSCSQMLSINSQLLFQWLCPV